MSEVIRTGGGRFDPKEQNIYFIASSPHRLVAACKDNTYLLVALNELEGETQLAQVRSWLNDARYRIFLDSGVYNLAMTYAHKHGVSMDIALSASPNEVEGFENLFDRYVDVVRSFGDRLWCYIEIDQGGRENKIKTRARLEALGLRPTPVYHPLNDGWDYFDYLAERYDRICFGNIVKADAVTRQKLIATAWERHRKYPNLWIHLLGFTPNQWLNALPINSGDSSTWLAPVRWPSFPVSCNGSSIGHLNMGYRYVLTKDGGDPEAENGSVKTVALCGYKSYMDMLTWRTYMTNLAELGFELYPAPQGEPKRATSN